MPNNSQLVINISTEPVKRKSESTNDKSSVSFSVRKRWRTLNARRHRRMQVTQRQRPNPTTLNDTLSNRLSFLGNAPPTVDTTTLSQPKQQPTNRLLVKRVKLNAARQLVVALPVDSANQSSGTDQLAGIQSASQSLSIDINQSSNCALADCNWSRMKSKILRCQAATPAALPTATVAIDTSTSEFGENERLCAANGHRGVTKELAIDCEMVGVGEKGCESILARVAIVNKFGHCLLDKFVRPTERVTDYRTFVSGIRPSDLRKRGQAFAAVQREVAVLLKNRVLVGHALSNDLQALMLDHPRKMIRDTSRLKFFRRAFGGNIPSLKRLSSKYLGLDVQQGEHSPVEDAQAAMKLYVMHRREFVKELAEKRQKRQSRRPDSAVDATGGCAKK